MSEIDPEILLHIPKELSDVLIRGQFAGYIDGFARIMVLRAAFELGIFDITSKGADIQKICNDCKTDRELTGMLCDCLIEMGLLSKNGEMYSNTDSSALFLDSKSVLFQKNSMEGLFHEADKWLLLEDRLRNGPAHIPREEMFGERWIKAIGESCMGGIVGTVIDAVCKHVDLSKYRTMLDLGGGHGFYAIGFAHKYRNLKVSLFDLPMMCPIAKSNSEKFGTPLDVIGGDFYKDDLGGPYDVVFSSFNLSTSDIKMCDRVFSSVSKNGLLILRRHLPNTSHNVLGNLEWCLNTWDGKGDKYYGGSWLPTSEQYIERMIDLGMEILVREQFDKVSEIVIMKK